MNPEKKSIAEILGNLNKYIIPVYQRNYAWQKAQCKQLLDDFGKIGEEETYFLGSMIWAKPSDIKQEYIIVDGQQRLTTLFILIIAIYNSLKKEDPLRGKAEAFFKNHISREVKLSPNFKDVKSFENIQNLDGKWKNEKEASNVENNYNFFLEALENGFDIEKFLNNLSNQVYCINIIIEGKDKASLIFESINSKGLQLNDGELIRNFLLMDFGQKEQEELYTQYWSKIEDLIGANEIKNFAFHFIRYEKQENIKFSEIYFVFKSHVKDRKKMLIKMEKFSKLYAILKGLQKYENKKIQQRIQRFVDLKLTVHIPYLFALIDDFENNKISEDIILKSLDLLENYSFRKLLIKGSSTGLNREFATLYKRVNNNFESLEKIIHKNIVPNDKLIKFLKEEDLYGNRDTSLIRYMLDRMENHNQEHTIENIQEKEIEHIFPQTPEDKSVYGEDLTSLQKVKHRIGNLSIISSKKNKQVRNKKEEDKLPIDDEGLKKLWLNSMRNTQNKIFSYQNFLDRQETMIKRALQAWFLNSKTQDAVEGDFISIQEDEDFSLVMHKKPKEITFYYSGNSKTILIKNWNELPIEITKEFYTHSPWEVRDFWQGISKNNQLTDKNNEYFKKIEELDISVKTHGSSVDILKNIKKMFNDVVIIGLNDITIKIIEIQDI
jgi:uncharacterized protein with ParB-like and HNH nuclease domain